MNAVDILIIAVLLLWVLFSLRWIWQRKKSGKCIGCGGDCSTCPSAQHRPQKENPRHHP